MKIDFSHSLSLLLLIITLSACSYNYRNILISGVVRDEVTNRPIHNAQVILECWVYSTETWDSQKIIKSTFTDNGGFYEINFEKGEAIDITVNAEGYNNQKKSVTLESSNIEINIELVKNQLGLKKP